MVIRLISVSDDMHLPEFHDVFRRHRRSAQTATTPFMFDALAGRRADVAPADERSADDLSHIFDGPEPDDDA
jgi:hypothetical protein